MPEDRQFRENPWIISGLVWANSVSISLYRKTCNNWDISHNFHINSFSETIAKSLYFKLIDTLRLSGRCLRFVCDLSKEKPIMGNRFVHQIYGGGEGSRTPVQIVLHIQASTVYSATDDQTLVNGPTWFDLSDWIVGEFRTNDWIPYSSFLLPSPSLRTNPGRHAEV
jgi:hypothetical protein